MVLFNILIAINALAVFVEEALDATLGAADAMGILADLACHSLTAHAAIVNTLCTQEHKNQSHADISAVHSLVKVVGAGIVVNVNVDLGHSGEGMHDREVILCHSKLCFGKLVGILKALVLLAGLKALGLDSGHIENIEGRLPTL